MKYGGVSDAPDSAVQEMHFIFRDMHAENARRSGLRSAPPCRRARKARAVGAGVDRGQ